MEIDSSFISMTLKKYLKKETSILIIFKEILWLLSKKRKRDLLRRAEGVGRRKKPKIKTNLLPRT